MDMSKYREMFLSEAGEHLKNMSRLMLSLEQDPRDREGIDALFREAHSIKGMAASMGYERTTELAHHLEDLMDGFRREGQVPPEAVDRMLEGIDLLEGLLQDLAGDLPEREVTAFLQAAAPLIAEEAGGEPGGEPGEEPPAARTPLQVVMELRPDAAAPAARLLLARRELESLGELHACSPEEEALRRGEGGRRLEGRLSSTASAAEVRSRLAALADVARVEVKKAGEESGNVVLSRREDSSRTVRLKTDLLDRFIDLTGELTTCRNMLQSSAESEEWPQVEEGLERLARLVKDLHHQVLQVRMMPLESITGRLPRLVRDLSRKSGREISLRIEGEDVELDRTILEQLADPLIHLVRNAADHGLPEGGEIAVRAWREKGMVLLEVADNGRGIDLERVRQKALTQGLLSPAQARSLHSRELLQIICRPGFSTAERITETSGRGVGMDVVKAVVQGLGGLLEIDSELGRGTRILLKLPLSVAIIKILLVECGGHWTGIPLTRVLRTLEIERRQVRSSGRQLVARLQDEMVPLLSLRKILGLSPGAHPHTLPVVVSEARGRRVGLVVDRLVGQREVFVKALRFPLSAVSGLSGATLLGDGRLVFVLDPPALLDSFGPAATAAAGAAS